MSSEPPQSVEKLHGSTKSSKSPFRSLSFPFAFIAIARSVPHGHGRRPYTPTSDSSSERGAVLPSRVASCLHTVIDCQLSASHLTTGSNEAHGTSTRSRNDSFQGTRGYSGPELVSSENPTQYSGLGLSNSGGESSFGAHPRSSPQAFVNIEASQSPPEPPGAPVTSRAPRTCLLFPT